MPPNPLQCLSFTIFPYGGIHECSTRLGDQHAAATNAHPPIAVGNRSSGGVNCAQNQRVTVLFEREYRFCNNEDSNGNRKWLSGSTGWRIGFKQIVSQGRAYTIRSSS